jgi:prolipoprotein diacylglyceryltransferase
MEWSLLWAALIGVGAMYGVLRWEAGRTNAADCTRALWDALLSGVLAGVAVGRIAAMLADGTNPLAHPTDVLIVRGGVDPGFASLAALGTVVIMLRRLDGGLWWALDAAAPAALAGLAAWHGACVVRDGCLGAATDLAWGLAQAGSDIGRHPVEAYAALALAAAVVGLVAWKRRRPADGVVAAAALAVAAAVRLGTEPMRLAVGTRPIAWYAAGVVAGLGALAWRLRHRSPSSPG